MLVNDTRTLQYPDTEFLVIVITLDKSILRSAKSTKLCYKWWHKHITLETFYI